MASCRCRSPKSCLSLPLKQIAHLLYSKGDQMLDVSFFAARTYEWQRRRVRPATQKDSLTT
ncbi:hypothetical protein E2C01_057453 [Portunus trituberculatus]|uniref:Uncharacterized protein n=1 Tax=Portunus trituberculatus TaxID=210409 RepID=A0A5B7H139_PORTR|nr:hypothetical protein [Portunus trituberculatus]